MISVNVCNMETNYLKEDDVDALRLNPFFRRVAEPDNQSVSKKKEQKAIVQPKATKFIVGPSEEECYSTDNRRRGICFVISNDDFHPSLRLSERKGSEVDLKGVEATFQNLGFEVRVLPNLLYSELIKTLNNAAVLEDHSDVDALAVVVLSHGNEGTIYAYDKPFPTQRLWEPFTAENAPSLTGKPKLFFIQACQGNQMDDGVNVTQKDSDVFASYKVPVHSDFLIAHSTISGYYSWRNTVNGSWFIQSMIAVFKDYASQRRDMLTLLTIISKRVALDYESASSRREFNNKKQTPFFYSTLRYKLYLSPKPMAAKKANDD